MRVFKKKQSRIIVIVLLALLPFFSVNLDYATAQYKQQPDFTQLIADLESERLATQACALHELKKLGKGAQPATEALIKVLDSNNKDVIYEAVFILGEIGSYKAVPALIGILDHEDKNVASIAITALGKIRSHKAIPALTKILDDDHRHKKVRLSAARSLGEFGPDASNAVPVLISMLNDQAYDIRKAARHTLAKIGPAAMPSLLHSLESDEECVVKEAALTLGSFGSKAVDPLRKKLSDKRASVRAAAALALGRIGFDAQAAIPDLIEMLEDESVYGTGTFVNSAAAEALGEFGPQAKVAVPHLIKAMKDGNESAVYALGKIGPAAKAAVPGLIELIDSTEYQVRYNAIKALGGIGENSRTAIPELVSELRNSDNKDYSGTITQSLVKIGPDTIPLIIEILKDENYRYRDSVITALCEMGPEAKEAAPFLANLALKGNRLATATLLAIGFDTHGTVLNALGNPESARYAADVFFQTGTKAVEPMVFALNQPDTIKQKWACKVLEQLSTEAASALPTLVEVTVTTRDNEVWLAAERALFSIGISPAIPMLIKFLENDDISNRRAAVTILGKIAQGAPFKERYRALNEKSIPLKRGAPRWFTPGRGHYPITQAENFAALDGLLLAICNDKLEIREKAAENLGKPNAEVDYIVTRLLANVENARPEVRKSSLKALCQLWYEERNTRSRQHQNIPISNSKNAIPILIRILKGSDQNLLASAVNALSQLGSDAKPAVKPIMAILQNTDPNKNPALHRTAINALGNIGPDAEESVQLLVQHLAFDRNSRDVSTALGKIGPAAIPKLIEAIKDDRNHIRDHATRALRLMEEDSRNAIHALIPIIAEGESTMRLRAISVLSEIYWYSKEDARKAIPALTKALEDKDKLVGQKASRLLKSIE